MSPLKIFKVALEWIMGQKKDNQMTKVKITSIISAILLALPSAAKAGAGVSGGLSLLSEGSARWSSLGQAGVAAQDDVAGMAYNPASIASLKSGQASFLYQQGLIEDSQGQFMIGSPFKKKSALGLSVNYYNAGKIDIVDSNGAANSVDAQQDLSLGLGLAHNLGNISFGINGKMLQSELIGEYKATAYAMDLGLQSAITPRLNIGAAMLNYGTKLTYLSEGDSLPRMLDAGLSYLVLQGKAPTTLLFDTRYMVNEKATIPSFGVETLVGPLAIRAGYRTGNGQAEMTFGAGFALGRTNVDYAFGMMDQLDATHKISMGMKFGGVSAARMDNPFAKRKVNRDVQEVKKTEEQPVRAAAVAVPQERRHSLGGQTVLRTPVRRQQRRVYMVKQGDTLGSIARNEMGDKRQWQSIYKANAHLMDDPSDLKEGMKIIIP